ncbi:MAG TPA: ABC transporter ATP-binding protein [Bacilli bacterium]|nr:ABC transporter ATP-binding protein [Bacilli bacterium]
MTYVTVENLTVSFGMDPILTDINCSLKKGKIHTVIGPNGSGKSTFIKAITKALQPKSGVVHIDGKLLSTIRIKDLAKIMATVVQTPEIPNDLTVRELVAYGRFPYRRMFKVNKDDQRIVEDAIKQMKLTHLAERKVSQLSGGERQRAWIGLALAQEPTLLILDEPTTYLDICHQYEILELIQSLNKEKDLTVLMVLHDLNHASLYSDYILAIENHKLAAFGTPEELFTPTFIKRLFNVECNCIPSENGRPFLLIKGLNKGAE